MAYVSLYRKYRPQTFAEVVGQDQVTTTLIHALEEDRLHHAYLFTGPRGTGKTSTARLLAKAINCEQGPTPTPCNECEHCTSIASGSSVDVIELDMASHGGVDDARDLRDRALFAPARARRKVYILDEVHMASTAAFNALLKLIEEPPEHVMFAMATTDPQKVLPTIMSRVQRLDLRRISAADVAGNVRALCAAEGYEIEDGAVDAIVRAGDGSLRDTQSVLEQVLSFAGHEVTTEAVAQVLGHTPADRVFDAVSRIAERDLAGIFGLVQSLLDSGHDLRRFTLDLVQHLRDLLVLQVAPDRPDLVDATDARRRQLQAQTTAMPRESLLRAVDVLAGTLAEQRQGPPRLPLELALAQLAVPAAGGELPDLADRVARLEVGAPTPAPAATTVRGAEVADPTAGGAPPSGAKDEAMAKARGTVPPPSPVPPPAPQPGPSPQPDPQPEPAPEPPQPEPEPAPARTEPEPAAEPQSEPSPQPDPAPSAQAEPEPAPSAQAEPEPAPEPAPAPDPDSDAGPPQEESVPNEAGSGDGDSWGPVPTTPAAGSASSLRGGATEPSDSGEATATEAGPGAEDGTESAVNDLDVIERHWEGILDLVKRRSRRCHAVFEPATPVRLSRGILTLRYPSRYASFHAQNAPKGEYAEALTESVERASGLRVRVEAIVEGEDHRRRPQPPTVTPHDARTPVIDDDEGPTPEEEAEVREAEQAPRVAAPDDADALLVRELDARLVDEQRPPATS